MTLHVAHIQAMIESLRPVCAAGFTVAGCYAAGSLVMVRLGAAPRRGEKIPLAFVLGAACIHLAVFAAMALKIAYRPVWLVVLGAPVAAALWNGSWRLPARSEKDPPVRGAMAILAALIFLGFSILYFINAWAPEISPDGSDYHLGLVARYLRVHGFERIATNMYASLGQGVEMLYAPAVAMGQYSAAALVHFAFAIALALAIFAYGRRIGKPRAGAAAALLVYLSPVVGRDGTTAYVDVAVAAIVFSPFFWLEIWDERRSMMLLIPAGLLAGYAYAAKYTAGVMLIYALAVVAWRARKIRPLLILSACAAVTIAPWMLKDWIYVHNPVAPFFDGIFRNPYIHISVERGWAADLRRYDIANLWTLPWEDTIRGLKTQGIIGPIFLLAPIALLALRNRAGRRLLVAGAVLLATYFANIGTRFLIPALPFFALAMTIAFENLPVALAAFVVFHAIASSPAAMSRYADRYAWRIEHFPYRAALRVIPEQAYLRGNIGGYGTLVLLNTAPPGERIFSLQSAPTAYMQDELDVGYESAFGSTLQDILFTGWDGAYQPTREFVFRFPEHTMNRIRLVQTARAADVQQQWNVTELRFFHHGVELPRSPVWRLRAQPNPWEIQLAFDNSPATRWRSWEAGAPGMYIDVDFGREENVDEVRMETSADGAWPIRFKVEMANANGGWAKLTDQFEERAMRARGSIRRAATYEFNARGIHYILVRNDDWGAADFRDDPASWGLQVAGRSPGAVLYKVIP